MQHLLTQEELDNLVPKSKVGRRDKALEIARGIILYESQFSCIHDRKQKYGNYCDDCPVHLKAPNHFELICTDIKNWSK
jgi:hypothetical protein